jgi:hypothetical protein
MQADEEYGEHVEPKHYSYFEEVFKAPSVKEWLGWSDEDRRFTNDEHLREFYSWMLGDILDNGDLGEPKFDEAKSVRNLAKIIDDVNSMVVFRAVGGTLTGALARFESGHPQEWMPAVANAQTVLAGLSPDVLRGLLEEEVTALRNLGERIQRVLDDRRRLLDDHNG